MGTRLITDEAHYFSSFRINPLAYANEIKAGYTEGYTAKDYALFKEAVLTSQSLFDSRSKAGCVNEFAMFVETELGIGFDNLTKYIRFTKNDCMFVFDIRCFEINPDNHCPIYPFVFNIRCFEMVIATIMYMNLKSLLLT